MDRDTQGCFVELYIPQLAKSVDAGVSGECLIGEFIRETSGEFGLFGARCALITLLGKRTLDPGKTLKEEGIRNGDKLILLYKTMEEERRG